MGDDGLAVGAALCYLRDRDGLSTWLQQRRRLDNVYLGQDFDSRIDTVLAAVPDVRQLPGDPIELATALVEAGSAGAVFVGRMEDGRRALGARSIIANPTDPTINDRLNERLDVRNSCRSPPTCWKRTPRACSKSDRITATRPAS